MISKQHLKPVKRLSSVAFQVKERTTLQHPAIYTIAGRKGKETHTPEHLQNLHAKASGRDPVFDATSGCAVRRDVQVSNSALFLPFCCWGNAPPLLDQSREKSATL